MSGSTPLSERYRRAAAELPTSVAAASTGSAVDGHWIDAQHFFFVTEAEVDGVGIIPLPFIASRTAGAAAPALAPDILCGLLQAAEPGGIDLGAVRYGCPAPGVLAAQVGPRVLTIDLGGGRAVGDTPLPVRPELPSPTGRLALLLDGNDLAIRETATGAVRRLTTDGLPDCPYGQQAQSSLSTLAYRRNPQPVALWSPDETWILTHRIDERHLPERVLVESAPGGGPPIAHRFRYAAARDPLPQVTLVAIHLPSGRRVELPPEEMALFPPLMSRSVWFVGNDRICLLRSDRHQQRLALVLIDLETGAERLLFEECTTSGYLEPHPVLGQAPNIRYLPLTEELLWWSERDGWGHLYLVDAARGEVSRQLTSGEWAVRDVIDVDIERRSVLFTAGGLANGDPLLRSLARVSLEGGAVELLVEGSTDAGEAAVRPEPVAGGLPDPLRPAGARVSLAPDGDVVVMRRSSPLGGTRTDIVNLGGGQAFTIARGAAATPAPMTLWHDVVAADGTGGLKAALFRPRDHDGLASLPLVDLVYPGPQSVFLARTEGGRVAQQAQALAELGLAVMVTDSRGLPFRSRDFHQQGHGRLLEPQMADHVAVIDQLCRRHGFIDRSRVGILGSSAGGAAAAYALLAYPQVYHVGAALCGPYDPADYLCGWMLKYVGADVDGRWEQERMARLAGQLRGRLLLIHGELDDNVHPSQTMRLAAALVEAGRRFEMLIVPGAGHLLQLASPHVQQRIWDHFVTHLRGETPPDDVSLAYGAPELAVLARVNGREALWL